ncbi:hypothetical protein [Micavibrio aeruginosavorus]|uniref:hypothetical protein n=1 Tax=Micavibrio aeruginosavorus TaxID=349221 RepID=UPI003F4AEAC6
METKDSFNNSAQTPPAPLRLTARFSRPGDEQIVRDFYHTFKHEFVEERDHAVLDKYTQDNRIILFFDRDNASLCASSIALSHNLNAPAKGPVKKSTWTEIGATRIALKGFNLSPFMVSAQIMHEMFKRPPAQFFFADIYKKNTTASGILSQVIGWHFFEPEDDLWDASELRHEDGLLDWLRCTTQTLPQQARLLLKTIDKPSITNRTTGQVANIDLSEMTWLRGKRAALENIANGTVSTILLDPAANQNVGWAATQFPKRAAPQKAGPAPQP